MFTVASRRARRLFPRRRVIPATVPRAARVGRYILPLRRIAPVAANSYRRNIAEYPREGDPVERCSGSLECRVLSQAAGTVHAEYFNHIVSPFIRFTCRSTSRLNPFKPRHVRE